MQKNVANWERIASVIVGGLALQQTLRSERSLSARTAAGSLGAAMLWRGLSGNCPVYSQLDMSTVKNSALSPMTPQLYEKSALVNLPPDEVAAFLQTESTPWGRFSPGSDDFEYQLDLDGKRWTLNLSQHADGKRTLIKTTVDETGDGESHGDTMLSLRQLKSLLETGEIATVEGQPHGERSSIGAFFEKFGDGLMQTMQSKTALIGGDETLVPAAAEKSPEIKLRKEVRA